MTNEGNITTELQRVRANALQEDNLWRILSFLGGRQQRAWFSKFATAREAARFYNDFSLVCKGWKGVCDAKLGTIMGPLEVQSSEHPNVFDFIKPENYNWLRNFAPPLKLGYASGFYGISSEAQMNAFVNLLSHCNTQELKTVGLNFTQLLQLDDSISQSTVLEDLTIYFDTKISDQECHDFLANNPLFSKKTIKRLELIHKYFSSSVPRTFPKQLMTNLSSLTHLSLSGIHPNQLKGSMHISSNTLQVLDIQRLRNTCVFCKCPELKAYKCTFKSGSLPNIGTKNVYNNVWRLFGEFGGVDSEYLTILRLSAKDLAKEFDLAFVGLEVPLSCFITVKDWGEYYRRRFDEVHEQNHELQWEVLDVGLDAFQQQLRSVQVCFDSRAWEQDDNAL